MSFKAKLEASGHAALKPFMIAHCKPTTKNLPLVRHCHVSCTVCKDQPPYR